MRELRVAILGGGGFMGRAHSLAYDLARVRTDLGYRLIKDTLVDVPGVAERAASDLGWATSATDWPDVVARPDIDIVDICTPPHLHAEMALAAIAAGKHVFCEKPITNDSREAETMAMAARDQGIVAQVGFNYRNSAAVRLAHKLIQDKVIGDVLQLRIQYVMDGAWLGDLGWRGNRTSGGSGALGDVGSHIIDMAEWLVGNIVEVIGDTAAYGASQAGGVEDAGVFLARFERGGLGSFSFNLKAWGQKNRIYFELDGSSGALAFDWNLRDELQVLIAENGAETEGFRRVITHGVHDGMWFDLGGLGSGYLEASANQFVSFLTAIVSGTAADPDFEHGAQVQRVVEAVYASTKTRSWVTVGSARA